MNNKISSLLLITLLISSCSKSEPPVPNRWYTKTQVTSGNKVFQQNCAACHGAFAQGTLNWKKTLSDGSYPPPPLNGTAHTWHHPKSMLKATIRNGSISLGGKMPAFKNTLSDDDSEAVIAFFQSKWKPKIYQAWLKRGGLR